MRAAFLLIVLAFVAAVLAGAARVSWSYDDDFATAFAHREASWTTSTTCKACHPDQHRSWARTFHRTMTQEATGESVVGAFDGRVVTFWGVPARPIEREGRYFVEYLDPETRAVVRTLEVERTVGSRRYQQYLVRDEGAPGENYYRIPLLWHIGEERWIHLNGAFLGPDDANYDKHVALWNENCIFCHNTGPVPGLTNHDELVERRMRGEPVTATTHGAFVSHVAELGIACESCHGPGDEHSERNRDPFRRFALQLSGADDPTIVHPAKLDQVRSVEVCGQCHGQRMPKVDAEIIDWMQDGPSYRAGESLADQIRTVWQDTPPPELDATHAGFEQRFWGDGTPRLTAYEFQGVLQSPCYQQGEMSCLSCHTMHSGDVRGMIPEENRTNRACLQCHTELADDVSAHTRHAPTSSGSSCYACHMPKAVYGVLAIHRSHRIENPDIARDTEAGRPNACSTCHASESPLWIAERMREWWGDDYRDPTHRGDGAPLELSALVASLHAGDPVARAVAAERAGRDDAAVPARERIWLVPHLLLTLFDGYPTVRWFARRSLRSLSAQLDAEGIRLGLGPEVEAFDYLADPPTRQASVHALMQTWAGAVPEDLAPPPGVLLDRRFRPDLEEIARLVAMQSTKRIEIGE